MIFVTLKHPINIVDLGYASNAAQAAEYKERGYMALEELHTMPNEIASLRRRIDDQAILIASLRRQLGADHE